MVYLKEDISPTDTPTEDNVFLEEMNQLGGFYQNKILPYGLSIATPSKNIVGENLIGENVYVNVTVQQNINV